MNPEDQGYPSFAKVPRENRPGPRPSGLGAARGAVALVGPRVGRHRAGAVAGAVSWSDEGGRGLVGEAPGVQAARLRREALAWLHRRRGSV